MSDEPELGIIEPGSLACFACLAAFFVSFALPAHAQLRAEQITDATAAELTVGGPDAIGGVGDWWLGNGLVEAVIDDVSREYGLLQHGGTLVDLGVAGRDDDQISRIVPMINLSQRVVIDYDAVRAEVDPDGRFARVIVTSSGLDAVPRGGFFARAMNPLVPDPEDIAAVTAETIYELRPDEHFVRITTKLHNPGEDDAPVFAFGDLWMRGGRGGVGFLGDARVPERGRAFGARSMTQSASGSLGALATFSHAVLVGSPDFPPVSYSLYAPERSAGGHSLFGMFGKHVTLALGFVGDPDVDEIGLYSLARGLFGELGAGESWTFERRLRVSDRRDVAAHTDFVFAELGALEESGFAGSVALAGRRAVVVIENEAGVPVTQLALEDEESGPVRFAAALPPGAYHAVLRAEHAPEQRVPLPVEAGVISTLGFHGLPAPARLAFEPAFADGGPGRIEVRGLDGTPDPIFGDDLLGAALDDDPMPSSTSTTALLFTGTAADPREVAIAPGRYRLIATRGLDWELAETVVEVPEDGARVVVPPSALAPLEPVAGYASADLHVHGQASHDTQVPNEERLRRYVAEGVHVLVATDHDNVPDFRPAIGRLGLDGRLRVVHGVEATTSAPSREVPYTIGHHNAWPVAKRAHAHRGGAPETQNRSIGALYDALRRDHGARVIQLNHPRPTPKNRANDDLDDAFFEHLGVGTPFDPARPLDDPGHAALLQADAEGGARPIDFDALEVMNGQSWAQYLDVRADWYALLRQGVRRTATANSDSHIPAELPAYPRNYVFVGPDGDAAERFDEALRAGRSFGTTGPRIRRLLVNGASLGDLASAAGGRVRIDWQVDAASWVPIDEVRVLVDGEVVHTAPELVGDLEWTLERDAFVTLEAGVPLDVDPEEWIAANPGPYTEVVAPGFVSTALANPVFVDVDGNGVFDAPGL